MPLLIGILGQAKSGKDTMADHLVDKYNFARVGLADPLKRFCKELFNFSDEQLWGSTHEKEKVDLRYPTGLGHLSPRVAFQSLGDWGRSGYKDVWVDNALQAASDILNDKGRYDPKKGITKYRFWDHWFGKCKNANGVVISDVRFRNEILKIRRAGGVIVRLKRFGAEGNVGIKGHSSEAEQKSIPDSEVDYILHVPPGIPNFHKEIDDLMARIPRRS